ncbi:Carbamoyl-phosphate synthase large chain [Spatholobus suberectus]|nr:Carbamoyl-phosphate synthase large chain [Spatholobus suberectus]
MHLLSHTAIRQWGHCRLAGIMEHIEQVAVHSGDSDCSISIRVVPSSCLEIIRSWTKNMAKQLNACGLINCQHAITASSEVFLLEANPQASCTVPFIKSNGATIVYICFPFFRLEKLFMKYILQERLFLLVKLE